MHVQHFMTRNPVTCDFDASCRDAARLMRERGVGCVIVLRNGRVEGLVTDRQLAVDCLGANGDGDVPVREIMTHDPACVTLEDNLFSVVDTLRSAGVVRRLPVVNSARELVGVVSLSDVAVVAKDLLDAILLDETNHALGEAKVFTGGRSVAREIRSPRNSRSVTDDFTAPPRPVNTPTPIAPAPFDSPAGSGNGDKWKHSGRRSILRRARRKVKQVGRALKRDG